MPQSPQTLQSEQPEIYVTAFANEGPEPCPLDEATLIPELSLKPPIPYPQSQTFFELFRWQLEPQMV